MNPQFCIHINNNLCSFIGFINDIPAFHNMKGMAYNLSVPINQFLVSGKNSFRVEIFPMVPSNMLEPLTDCKVDIIVKGQKELATAFTSIASAQFESGTITDQKQLPGFILSGIFIAEIPFPNFKWVKSPSLKKQEDTFTKLGIMFYKKFHEALKAKNLDYIIQSIINREKEMSIAYYANFEEEREKTKQAFAEVMNDKDWELQPFVPDKFIPRFYANKQIFALEDFKYDQPIFYINKLQNRIRQYPIYLCLNEENQFEIIR